MHKLLHLQHHRHTAKRLSHHHTSYRGLSVVLAFFGFTLALMQHTGAVSYTVRAKISAEIPLQPAVITSPPNKTIFTAPQIEVSGVCPYVSKGDLIASLWQDGVMLGSSPCVSNGNFAILLTLPSGATSLLPRIMNLTDDFGPDGTPIIIAYQPPGAKNKSGNPFNIPAEKPLPEGNFEYLNAKLGSSMILFSPQKPAELIINISGGKAPYAINVDWGDGSKEAWTEAKNGQITYSHIFNSQNPVRVKLNIASSDGQSAQFSIAAVTLAGQLAGKNNGLVNFGSNGPLNLRLSYVWWLYGSLVTVVFGLWLTRSYQNYLALLPIGRTNIGTTKYSKTSKKIQNKNLARKSTTRNLAKRKKK